jgi:hypothetical protein
MKHFLLRLLLPSPKAIARWERTRQRGLVRFTVVIGGAWLVLSLVLMGLFELMRPVGFFTGLASAFVDRPFRTIGILLGTSMVFGLTLYLVNDALYKIARGQIEP